MPQRLLDRRPQLIARDCARREDDDEARAFFFFFFVVVGSSLSSSSTAVSAAGRRRRPRHVVRAWTAPSRHRVEKAVAVQAAEGDTVTTLIASRVAVRLLW